MSRCRAVFKFRYTTSSPEIVLACDLDDHHLSIYPRHFDKTIGKNGLEWLEGAEPVGVPATRTTPPKNDKRAVRKSLAANVSSDTRAFVIIND
jgi:hypothetical protein